MSSPLGTISDGAYTAKVNIRSIIAPTLSRYPTEHQWDELDESAAYLS